MKSIAVIVGLLVSGATMQEKKSMVGQKSNVIQISGELSEKVEAEAASWLARVTSGVLTLGELAEFEWWRAHSPEHDRVYGELEAVWNAAGQGVFRHEVKRRPPALLRLPGRFSWWMRLGQIAAAIAFTFVTSQYFSTWRYDYHTASSEVRRVALADGSTILMKGDTALNARVSRTGARTVELARGEAFFDVVHDAQRPFTVIAGSGVVRDIGTAFSVARSGKSMTVAVEHGIVSVTNAGQSESMVAGEQLSFSLYATGRKRPIDTGSISPWRRGLYVADGQALGDVLSALGEYHSGTIILTSHALSVRRVNAVVKLDNIDLWLDSLNEAPGVSVKRWGPFTVVSDRKG